MLFKGGVGWGGIRGTGGWGRRGLEVFRISVGIESCLFIGFIGGYLIIGRRGSW